MPQLTPYSTGASASTVATHLRARGKAVPLWTFVVAALVLAPSGTAGLALAALVAALAQAAVAAAAVDARAPALST